MKLIAETCGPLNSRFLIDLTGFSHHPFQSEAVADEDGADLTIGAPADWSLFLLCAQLHCQFRSPGKCLTLLYGRGHVCEICKNILFRRRIAVPKGHRIALYRIGAELEEHPSFSKVAVAEG
jgi:hypothetical protein